ncbi:GntR family transcriptional regulator [Prosthecomicrobium pneumaticum]|uniref:DNA-binding GntR family transcriptional regulator n=1 Tax=Prosthecomicrobium pneumaticum TaxID=81895 RepID=A0A7W9L2F2_9HYPH|nr:GntR family transcriptional regulator [Prosthecomicrobium pneumaticum]MBB5753458.1 DNA-binding GntR family transcriptional regulator [Prosthecomicrobium pneumaticum]
MTLVRSMDGPTVAGLDAAPPEASLAEFAYNRLVEMMLGGVLAAGEVLQERKLSEALSVSRTPVREALTRLEAESLVARRHGRVLVVSDMSIETCVNTLDMRRTLEMEAAARATGRISRGEAARIAAAIDALLETAEITPTHHWAVDEMVHGSIAEAAGNPMATAAIRDLRRRTHIFNTARIPHRLLPGASEHLELLDAVSGEDAERSRRLMGRHIDNVKSAIIDYILGARRP